MGCPKGMGGVKKRPRPCVWTDPDQLFFLPHITVALAAPSISNAVLATVALAEAEPGSLEHFVFSYYFRTLPIFP